MSVALMDLWLAILASSVVVFIASFIVHMVLPHHKKDWRKLPNEQALLEYVRSIDAPAGQYMFPGCEDWSELKDPEKKKAWEAGPFGQVRILPAMPSMGRNLALTFLTYILISLFVAYLATQALEAGANFRAVFRFTGTAAIMAYCLGFIGNAIWFGQPRNVFLKDVADNVVYGLLTGVVFGVMWPAIETPEVTLPGLGG